MTPSNYGRETGVLPSHTSCTSSVAALEQALGVPTSFPADLSNRALINARNNLKGNSLNLGVAFGERRETAEFIGDTFYLMRDFLLAMRDVRKLKTRKAEKRLKYLFEKTFGFSHYDTFKKIPSVRLQWQYAVKPLISDIYASCKALEDHSRDAWKVTVKGKANRKYETGGMPLHSTLTRDQCIARGSADFKCMVRIDVQPGNDALRKASEFGLTNPVSWAWELIPLSFVVDWCIPIGDYLSCLDAMAGWELLGFSTSSFTKKKYDFTGTSNKIGITRVDANSWSKRYRSVSLVRGVGSSVPFPTFPNVSDKRSLSHVADGFALFASAASKFGRHH